MIIRSDSLAELLAELKRTRFYGLVSFQFRDGEVTLVERKETFLTDKSNSTTKGRTIRYEHNER